MKKIIYLFTIVFTFVFVSNFSFATSTPTYDSTFDNNKGAFYANGTSIVITKDTSGNTVINWDGGSQIVPSTVTVFGGGSSGTFFDTASITMQDGTVSDLVAGGISTVEASPASVTNATITVDGGTVLGNISGGGYLYATVDNSNIVINDVNVSAVTGGGFATVTIGGTYYEVGSATNPKASPNRTENSSIVINGGTIKYPSGEDGLVFGGGQGYSYVGTTKVEINGGDLSNAYITAGGSNGYTGNSTVEISGGNAKIYQSVNRGIVDMASLKVSGGTIQNLYVAGETEDQTVTGIINNANIKLIGGTINTLDTGKSNSQPITINNKEYVVVKADTVNVVNDKIATGEVKVVTNMVLDKDTLTLFKSATQKVNTEITTTPSGYENLFTDKVVWKSTDENVATVSQDGVVTGMNEGKTTITANLLGKTQNVLVTVDNNNLYLLLFWILVPLAVIIFLVLLYFYIESLL